MATVPTGIEVLDIATAHIAPGNRSHGIEAKGAATVVPVPCRRG